ncbi:hypothetical protein ACQP3L_34795, partial [Escherichia coli]
MPASGILFVNTQGNVAIQMTFTPGYQIVPSECYTAVTSLEPTELANWVFSHPTGLEAEGSSSL